MGAVRAVSTVPASSTQRIGHYLPGRNDKEKKDYLRYLRRNKAIFAHEVGGTKYFPIFQFNSDLSCVDANVGDVNEILIERFLSAGHSIQSVQDWWVNGKISSETDSAPMRMVKESPELVLDAAKRGVS